MYITNSGDTMEGGKLEFVTQATPNVAVSSVTFSGLDGDNDRLYGIKIDWQNPLTGASKLALLPNGQSVPQGSSLAREQFETQIGVREDAADAVFTIADLQAGVAGTEVEAAVFLSSSSINADGSPAGRFMQVRGFANDGASLLGNRKRHFRRTGFINDSDSQWTSLALSIDGGASAIGPGSDIRLWKAL